MKSEVRGQKEEGKFWFWAYVAFGVVFFALLALALLDCDGGPKMNPAAVAEPEMAAPPIEYDMEVSPELDFAYETEKWSMTWDDEHITITGTGYTMTLVDFFAPDPECPPDICSRDFELQGAVGPLE